MKNNTRMILLVVLLVAAVAYVFMGCGGTATTNNSNDDDNTSGISSAPQFDSIGDLPTATTKVVSAETAASLSAVKYAASTGLPFGTTESTDFVAGTSSMAMCETFNETKWALNMAVQGSTIFCYVQTTFEAIAADESNPANAVDIYDGEWHNFHLMGGSAEFDAPDYFRVKITTDDDDYITGFTMYSCRDGEQDMYLNQTIDNTTGEFTMTNISSYSDGEGNGMEQASVTGYVNSLGYFEGSKDLVMDFTNNWDEDDIEGENTGHMTFTQTETTGTLNGIMDGGYTEGENSGTYTNKAYAYYQMIDGNSGSTYDVGLLALGDGAAQYSFDGTNTACEDCDWSDTGTESWDGDTTASETSNAYTETAEEGGFLTTSSISTPSFGDYAIDCDTLEEDATDIDFSELGVNPEETCNQLDHEHIECWSLLGEEE